MRIKFLWKDPESREEHCPALYDVAEPDGYVVQGKKLDAETRAQLRQLADDEDGVFVPRAVLDKLRDL